MFFVFFIYKSYYKVSFICIWNPNTKKKLARTEFNWHNYTKTEDTICLIFLLFLFLRYVPIESYIKMAFTNRFLPLTLKDVEKDSS